eukprot:CAMPEP_0119278644 /NCGR_PEP_ID=MMETSP1329-20130426/19442_1 /TAXON_ID=114041 /ORGANISM="Genus nov. species nov., Strain RCC1024" /LENGTH=1235 /DNA_ID=CAMNT_0007279161 /DNA_START=508 /DNA_END=4215 /DNA_ORIENTATION=+
MSKIPQAMNEQSMAAIRVYCSMSPSQIEITKVVERLIAFASTRLSRQSSTPGEHPRDDKLDQACEAIYELCCARRLKHIVKSLPHAVRDLEAVYFTLTIPEQSWKTRFSLLLWLGMLMLNPFDINLIVLDDLSFVTGVVQYCCQTLNDAGPSREAAVFCLSTTLTRRDVSQSHFEHFVRRTTFLILDLTQKGPSFAAIGALAALSAAYKRGDRALAQNFALGVLEAIQPCFQDEQCLACRPLKQLAIKLAARVGASVLRPRIAPWCYARGKRSLLAISSVPAMTCIEKDSNEERSVGLEKESVSKILESVLDALLNGLSDPETKTRWSSAKGIGRIASRLPQHVADDVVKFVLAVFSAPPFIDKDGVWHGSCLALAELSRLGVLVPKRLPEALSALSVAVSYDRNHGGHHVGAHVRDSACYVAWAFARAYAPQTLQPHLSALIENILLVALFDREIHVRRAAGAALQENIGRQGVQVFGSRGIELTQVVDFFSLGSRERSYVEIAPIVSTMGYFEPLYTHVLKCVKHWDVSIRLLAARSLCRLIEKLDNQGAKWHVSRRAVSHLVPIASESRKFASRHGSLLALTHIARSLKHIREGLMMALASVVPRLEAARLYRGKGGDLVRIAACSLIEALSSQSCQLPVKLQLRLLDSLDDSMGHAVEAVRTAAVNGVRALTLRYFGESGSIFSRPSGRLLSRTVFKYMNLVEQPTNANVSRGACRCLGALPRRLLLTSDWTFDSVIKALAARATRFDLVAGERDGETRRDALAALREIVIAVGPAPLTQARVVRLLDTFVRNACRDFGVDKRGDVGSWSRIQGLEATVKLSCVLNRTDGGRIQSKSASKLIIVSEFGERTNNFILCGSLANFVASKPYLKICSNFRWTAVASEQLCCALFRHLGEKLDTVRNVALRCLSTFFQKVPAVPRRREIETILFFNKQSNFPVRLCACLQLGGIYQDAILSGLIISAGSNDSRVSRSFRGALLKFSSEAARAQDYLDTLVLARTFSQNISAFGSTMNTPCNSADFLKMSSPEEQKRTLLPLLRCITAVVNAGAFAPLFDVVIPKASNQGCFRRATVRTLAAAVSTLVFRPKCTRDVRVTCAVADALLALLHASAITSPLISELALTALLQCLHSPYPRARAYIAERLYGTLLELSVSEICFLRQVSLLTAQAILSNVRWDAEDCAGILKEAVVELACTLEVEGRKLESPRLMGVTDVPSRDELESYAYLVKDAGY